MILTLGCDLAWGGFGWCAGSEVGPLAVGHVAPSGREWRWIALRDYLDGPFAAAVVDLQTRRGKVDPAPRIVVEEPPSVYSGASRGGKGGRPIGNQAKTGYGLGLIAGAVHLWSVQRGDELGYPWLVEPMEWRGWWSIGGKGRLEKKQRAVKLVRLMGWGALLDPYPWDPDPEAAGGAQGDVAEAICLQVGSARHIAGAPAGPARAVAPLVDTARRPAPVPRAPKVAKSAPPKNRPLYR